MEAFQWLGRGDVGQFQFRYPQRTPVPQPALTVGPQRYQPPVSMRPGAMPEFVNVRVMLRSDQGPDFLVIAEGITTRANLVRAHQYLTPPLGPNTIPAGYMIVGMPGVNDLFPVARHASAVLRILGLRDNRLLGLSGTASPFEWLAQQQFIPPVSPPARVLLEKGHRYRGVWLVPSPGGLCPPAPGILNQIGGLLTLGQPGWPGSQWGGLNVFTTLPQLASLPVPWPAGPSVQAPPGMCPVLTDGTWNPENVDIPLGALTGALTAIGGRLTQFWDQTPGEEKYLYSVAPEQAAPVPAGGGFECPPGYTVDVPTKTCLKSTAAAPDCRQRAGTYLDPATSLCVPCEAGTVPNATATACVPGTASAPTGASSGRSGGGGLVLAAVGVAVLIGAAVLIAK